ncbi:phage terminase large subunit [Endozoicomonas sp. GU-1]|uniref:phage terminase large subunit n=1 Tax=Endozoicomonas sp. GU-1 TaxID=3009078 RepID=UPI0022B4C819|nr:phage terminase large subunit [Endozoicomonas sp. GU-1]WBA79564.1 phage terminase large subunit [Endozoicomonas sp. GU-1]
MSESPLSLSDAQHRFLTLEKKFRAYVGGFGSGKTFAGCLDLCTFALAHPRLAQGYFAPTYPLIRDIFYPTVTEAAELLGMRTRIRESNKEVDLYLGRIYYGTIICRTMDNPANIVGFKIARALCDELDVMNGKKAEQAWNKIIARLRLVAPGVINGIGVTTTPEGFKFTYQRFKKSPGASYGLVQASTYENQAFLPPDYISSLRESYPGQLIEAYLLGEFVNLNAGTIYNQFDRKLNHCNDKIEGNEPLFIGMDFNVGKMAAVIHVKREGLPRAVEEIVNGFDTREMIQVIQSKYGSECSILIYPDSSGRNRKSVNASETDIGLLEQAGFTVCADPSNPAVKDRINAMNAMFCNAEGERRYLVNTDKCPVYTECLEQQVWAENGEPDKTADNDHCNDAGGYFIAHEYPVIKPVTNFKIGFAL